MTTAVANLDVTQYVKVNSERKSILLQATRDTVRIVLSDSQPALTNSVFHVLGGGDDPLHFFNIETDVWALAVTDRSGLVVTETDNTTQPSDYLTEVRKGNVSGASLDAVVCRNPAAGTTAEDLWGAGGTMVYPTAAEAWELVSDNANDTAAGTGMRTVLVQSRDGNGDTQLQTVTMNGTTPVALTGTHFRPAGIFGLTAGSTGYNEGTITLRSVTGSNPRNVMLPTVGRSHDTHYTVPAGKTAQILTTQILFPKDGSGQFMNMFRTNDADSAWQTGSVLRLYQNNVPFPFESRPPLTERSDLRLMAASDTGEIDVTVIFELLLLDN